MRVWSLHPKYLDSKGLVALWRETLLAQAVLRGQTRGYRHHPQLLRFRDHGKPIACVAEYLRIVHQESLARGYAFDRTKIGRGRAGGRITVSRGQIAHEWKHLLRKVRARDPKWLTRIEGVRRPEAHPLFTVVAGDIEEWERWARRPSGPGSA